MFHPASLLLLWGAGVALLQCLTLQPTLLATAFFLLLAGCFSKVLLLRLLSRSRWLFLTMGLLFLWLSPGVRLPAPWGDWGMTEEGLAFALEHMGRLAVMLALLALLLTKLNHRGIVSGFYLLLSPFKNVADARRVIAVRLMLTLEAVAGKTGGEWKSLLATQAVASQEAEARSLHLEMPLWSWRDNVLLAATLTGVVLALWFLGQS